MEVEINCNHIEVPDEFLLSQVVITFKNQQNVIFEAQMTLSQFIHMKQEQSDKYFLHIPFYTDNETKLDIKILGESVQATICLEKQVQAQIAELIMNIVCRPLTTYQTVQFYNKAENFQLDGQLTDSLKKTLDIEHLRVTTCYAMQSSWNYLMTYPVNSLQEIVIPPVKYNVQNTFLSVKYKHSFIFIKNVTKQHGNQQIKINKFVMETIVDGINKEQGDGYTIVNYERSALAILENAKEAAMEEIILKIGSFNSQWKQSFIQQQNNLNGNEFEMICTREDNNLNANLQFAYKPVDPFYQIKNDLNNTQMTIPQLSQEIFAEYQSFVVQIKLQYTSQETHFTIPNHTLCNKQNELQALLQLETPITKQKQIYDGSLVDQQMSESLDITVSNNDEGTSKHNQQSREKDEVTKEENDLCINISAFDLIQNYLQVIQFPNNQHVLIYAFQQYRDVLRLILARKQLFSLQLEKNLIISILKFQKVEIQSILLELLKQKFALLDQKQAKPQKQKSQLSYRELRPKPLLLKKPQKQLQAQSYVPLSLQLQNQFQRFYSKKTEQMISDILWFFRQRMTLMAGGSYKQQLTDDIMHFLIKH